MSWQFFKKVFKRMGKDQTKPEEKKQAIIPEMSAKGGSVSGAGEKKEKRRDQKKTGLTNQVLIKPLISEKGAWLGSENKYCFMVSPRANKIVIGNAIGELYGVRPLAVNIINVRGKAVRFGRSQGRTKNWKKAIVTLKAGEKIEVYET